MKRPLNEYWAVIKHKISNSNFEAALVNIERLLRVYPKDAQSFYYRGVCYFAMEKYHLAIKEYSIALRLNPAFAKAYFNIGVCYYMINYYDYALINIGKALFIFSRLKELDNKERCKEALELIESEQNL